ncbi:D-3-phosphoglycerate dehydrogenase [Acidimicrobiaceae bacterium]|nr:D-3-phosphoglycerate dehydrogenase [Acidimicrobiaceae bacterium]
MQVLISTSSFNLANFAQLENLKTAGVEVKLNPFEARLTEDQVIELLGTNTIGLIAGLEPLTKNVLQSAKSLKVIARVGTGLDSVDLAAAKQLGISVLNTPDAPTKAVAELTVAHILGLLRHLSKADRQIRSGVWKGLMGSLLETKTVGLVGFGRIGKRVATLLSAFGASVIISDAQVKASDFQNLELDELCAKADILSLHLPYNESTHHIINEKRINLMKKGSYIVNISRGGLIDETMLLGALKSGHIAGAALDCFEQEPYEGELRNLENVQITAHMGSYARETRDLMEQEASNLLVNALREMNLIK